MTETAAQIAAQVASDQQALAQADLATLQAFVTQLNTTTFTFESFIAAFQALPPTLGDPGRQNTVSNVVMAFQTAANQFEALVASTQAQASPPTQ
jgi:hypothetical protein